MVQGKIARFFFVEREFDGVCMVKKEKEKEKE